MRYTREAPSEGRHIRLLLRSLKVLARHQRQQLSQLLLSCLDRLKRELCELCLSLAATGPRRAHGVIILLVVDLGDVIFQVCSDGRGLISLLAVLKACNGTRTVSQGREWMVSTRHTGG